MKNPDPDSINNVNKELYHQYCQEDKADSVLKYGKLVIHYYKDRNDIDLLLEFYSDICAFLLYEIRSHYKQLAVLLDNYLKLAEKTQNEFHMANAHLLSADLLINADINLPVALEYLNRSLEIFSRIGDQYYIAILNYRLGNYYLKSDKGLALSYFLESAEINKKNNYQYRLMASYRRIAEVYRNNFNDYKNSRLYYKKVLEIARKINDPIAIADITIEYGCVDIQFNKTDSALYYYFLADSILRINLSRKKIDSHKYNGMINYLNSHLGVYFETIKEYEKALHYYSRLAPEYVVRNKHLPHPPLKTAELYEKLGDYKNAAKFYKEYYYLNDSLQKLQKAKDVAKLELRFELEEIEKENQRKLQAKESMVEKQKVVRNLFIILSFLLIVVIYLLFRNYKNKQQANKKVREADLMKIRFFTNISHEFRTPLTLIISPLKRILSDTSTKNINKLSELMLRNANKLKNLIDQLLDISKIDQGNLNLDIGRHDFNLLFKIATSMFHSIAEEKQINFLVIEEKDSLVFNFDNNRIEQVIHNLLSNAFKFTPKGGIIRTQVIKDNSKAILSVKDTGIGIPQKDINKIFNRFYRSALSVDGNYEGNGIGLSIVKEYVELHKGNIIVNSEINKGTEFIIELPLLDYEEKKTENQTALISNIEALSGEHYEDDQDKYSDKQKGTILIVEDNQDLRTYLSGCLSIKYNVIESINGSEGIEKAVNLVPDVIISDIMMPETDGYQLLSKVKTDVRTSHIPVILLTAKADQDSKLEGLQIGADDYLSKPFDEKELLLRIHNILQNRKRLQEKLRLQFSANPAEVKSLSKDELFLSKLVKIVEDNMEDPTLNVDKLSSQIGLSRQQLFRKLKALINQSPNRFIRTVRLKRARQLLQQKTASVSEIAYQTGFENLSYFTRKFKEEFNFPPSEYLDTNTKD